MVVLPDIILDGGTVDPLRYNLAAMVARFNWRSGRSQGAGETHAGRSSEHSVIQTKEPMVAEGQGGVSSSSLENRTNCPGLTRMARWWPLRKGRGDIWAELERTEPGRWGRIQLTDAIAELAKKYPLTRC